MPSLGEAQHHVDVRALGSPAERETDECKHGSD